MSIKRAFRKQQTTTRLINRGNNWRADKTAIIRERTPIETVRTNQLIHSTKISR